MIGMANMSYCRFNNTNIDLEECLDAIDEREIASKSEGEKAKMMFNRFLDFCESEGIIDGFDEEVLYKLIDRAVERDDDDE
jgi:hypothetical protein